MVKNSSNITLTDENFNSEVLRIKEPVLVDFWADWCEPCKMIAPVIEELAVDLQGHVKVGKLDIDNNPRIVTQYGIRSIPTLLIFMDGKVVNRVVGVVPKKEIVDKLNALLQSA